MKKKWTKRYNVKATQRGKKKALAPLVILAAHSSRLVLRNEDEDPKGDDDDVPGGGAWDETPEEGGDNDGMDDPDDEMPEEDADNDSASSDGQDKMPENAIDTQDETLASKFGAEISSSDQNTGEQLMEDELVSKIQEKHLWNTAPDIYFVRTPILQVTQIPASERHIETKMHPLQTTQKHQVQPPLGIKTAYFP